MNRFKSAFYTHKGLLLLSVLYMGAVSAMVFYGGGSARRFFYIVALYMASTTLALFFVLAILGWFLVLGVGGAKWRGSPMAWLREALAGFERRLDEYAGSGMLQNAFWGIIAMLPLLTFFSIAKSLIPVFTGFTWDPLISQADRLVHFGHYPHEWLMPVVQKFGLVRVFDGAYLIWFGVMFAANGFCLFCDRNMKRRMQYLWSFAICWIVLGTITAFLFASCGPVFFHTYYPALHNPYAGLGTWLQTANNGGPTDTLQVANYLYGMVSDNIHPDLNGISAMPSQHVAVAWLIALYTWRVNRGVGVAAFIYAVTILLASITLGWHYALDGYVGIAVVSIIWFLCGKGQGADREYLKPPV